MRHLFFYEKYLNFAQLKFILRVMSFSDIYKIPFKDLEQGKVHRFEFEVDNDFFKHYEYSQYKEGSVKVLVDLVVNPDNLVLDFYLSGKVKVVCDVCLGEFFHPIDYHTTLYVKLGDYNTDWFDYDDEIVIDRADTNLFIAKHIYDFINLALPIKKVHPPDENGNPTCDPFMLEKLRELSPSHEEDQDIDPRWEQLKNLLN